MGKKQAGAKKRPEKTKGSKLPLDKYALYLASVQAPDSDVEFMQDTYGALRQKKAKIFREDFCGTYATCQSWIKQGEDYHAIGVDIDPEPLSYGRTLAEKNLSPKEMQQLTVLEANVLDPNLPKADIICALNFSYFIFKQRSQLRDYLLMAKNRGRPPKGGRRDGV